MDGYFHYEAPCFDDDEVIITEDGLTTETKDAASQLSPRRVIFPTFELYQNPSIKIEDVKRRRFDVIDRAVQKARQEIMNQEDELIFKELDSIVSGNKDI